MFSHNFFPKKKKKLLFKEAKEIHNFDCTFFFKKFMGDCTFVLEP